MVSDEQLDELSQIPKDIGYDSSRKFGDRFTDHSGDRKVILKLVKTIKAERAWSKELEGSLEWIRDYEGGVLQPEPSKSNAMREMARETLDKKKEITGG